MIPGKYRSRNGSVSGKRERRSYSDRAARAKHRNASDEMSSPRCDEVEDLSRLEERIERLSAGVGERARMRSTIGQKAWLPTDQWGSRGNKIEAPIDLLRRLTLRFSGGPRSGPSAATGCLSGGRPRRGVR